MSAKECSSVEEQNRAVKEEATALEETMGSDSEEEVPITKRQLKLIRKRSFDDGASSSTLLMEEEQQRKEERKKELITSIRDINRKIKAGETEMITQKRSLQIKMDSVEKEYGTMKKSLEDQRQPLVQELSKIH